MERSQPGTLHPAPQDTDRRPLYGVRIAQGRLPHRRQHPGAVGDQRVSGSTQGRTRPGDDRIAEPTARMEKARVQPDSASGRRRIRYVVRPLRPTRLLCRRTGPDQHQPQRYVPPQGRNPTNDPAWQAAYIARIEESYHTTKLHPCVVAFSLAEDSANGINLYEGYLHLKGLERSARSSIPMQEENGTATSCDCRLNNNPSPLKKYRKGCLAMLRQPFFIRTTLQEHLKTPRFRQVLSDRFVLRSNTHDRNLPRTTSADSRQQVKRQATASE